MPDDFFDVPQNWNRRRRFFVDPQVQGALVGLVFKYWTWAALTFTGIMFAYCVLPVWLQFSDAPKTSFWSYLGPYLIGTVVLFPIVLWHVMRFSNRVVGPMVRVRRALKDISRGKIPAQITLRDGDFWTDVVDDINLIAKSMKTAPKKEEPSELETAEDSAQESEPELTAV